MVIGKLKKVVLPDGEKKEYKINRNNRFFKIEADKGFRKKVMPQLDGTYLTNDVQEEFVVVVKTEKLHCNIKQLTLLGMRKLLN